MAVAEDPVGAGLVKSLARPVGNITGMIVIVAQEVYGDNLELLKEILPRGAPRPSGSRSRRRWGCGRIR
jgi:ABC-type uncharacterized transport system substrate-binding protein